MSRTNGMKEQVEAASATGLIQAATRIYDAVYWFCETFLSSRSIMADQMVRSARSGRMNVVKAVIGREVSVAMQRRYIHLAGSQYDGLMLDCGDYLRHRRLKQWDEASPETTEIKERLAGLPAPSAGGGGQSALSDEEAWARFASWLEHEEPAVRINALIHLIRHIHSLLDSFLEREKPDCAGDRASSGEPGCESAGTPTRRTGAPGTSPDCPQCGRPMVKRTAKTGKAAGRPFWGCSGYPECKKIVDA